MRASVPFRRERMMERAAAGGEPWDVVVVGGGATGLGVAVDAATRGYRTLVLEGRDFGSGTSSRSTKLVHGGVRYLARGEVGLVREALSERRRLLRNAPHLVVPAPFVVPRYRWWEGLWYGTGLRLYDVLAGPHGLGRSRLVDARRAAELLPAVARAGLRGGVLYHDAQFDDARLALALARTAADHGAALVNHAPVTDLVVEGGRTRGAVFVDEETGLEHVARARIVINATGPFTDAVRRMAEPTAAAMMRPSQGIHLVLDRRFMPGEASLLVPRTDDGRVLFVIPWHGRVLLGTTDTPVPHPAPEPRALGEEVDYLLEHAARYLEPTPTRADVLSVWAGLRPLVGEGRHTADVSREHVIHLEPTGLLTVTGGKWTTYRSMAEAAGLPARACRTADLPLHGRADAPAHLDAYARYGSEASAVRALSLDEPALAAPLHRELAVTGAHVVWAARHEMARRLDDVLARRTRALHLHARAAVEAAPAAARLLAAELGRDAEWAEAEVEAFEQLASGYVV